MIQQGWNRSMGTEVSANANRERAETANIKSGGWIHWEKGIKPDKEWQYMIPKDTAHNKALNSYPPDHSINIQFSRSVVSNSLRLHGLQHARLPCSSPTPRAYSNSYPSHWWCHPTISSLLSPSPPAFNLSQHQGLFQWVSSSHQVAKVLEFQLQHQSLQWIFRTDFL